MPGDRREQNKTDVTSVRFPGGSVVKNSPANGGGSGSIPGSGRSPGQKNGNPLQYSCLEISMDKGVWRATAQGVTNGLDMTDQLNQQNHVHMEHILQPSSFVIISSGAAKDE